ncbi:MAG TPA: 23S rRNA (adenine(2503)-C(2))-methyltransferase RlmN [Terriglobia bacterium]|nr:23S rRNA (adenine(2503)-C(2))-methyltransferase RlmN [Terriglobia bacterium]
MRVFFDYERSELAEIFSPHFRAAQVYKSVYQRWFDNLELMTDLPKAFRASLAEEWNIHLPAVHRRFDSVDGTRRYLVRLDDGEFAETVFIPEENRNTICISSQIGCALDCKFCLTGQIGLVRHLRPGEIVTQVLVAQRDNLSWELRDTFNIVLMGMGEPLHNYDNVMKAIRILHDEHGLNMSMSRITLSTAGLLPGIERLANEPMIPNLAISLTGATNEKRNELMPINRKYPIEQLLDTVRQFPLKHRQRVTFEYVLLKGVTDSTDDALNLVKLLKGVRAKVNLIPLNEAEELSYRRPSDAAVERFQQVLIDHNISAFVRKNRGNDISAACGQLKKKWADEPVALLTRDRNAG